MAETILEIKNIKKEFVVKKTFTGQPKQMLRAVDGVSMTISKTGIKAGEFALDLLDKERVIVVPGTAFGEASDSYVRLSFATSEENILEGLRRIKWYVDGLAQ